MITMIGNGDGMDNELEEIKKKKLEEMMKRMQGDKMQTKIDVYDNDFEKEVIERSKEIPVVVDYWASWCMPCRILGPVLEKLANEYKGKFLLAKIDVQNNPIISQRYSIMSIPSVKMFKNGKVVDEFLGALPEVQVRNWLNKNI